MRLITFAHSYLSAKQAGIQSLHVLGEFIPEYLNPSFQISGGGYPKKDIEKRKMVYEWASLHKTHILLNGGNTESLTNIATRLMDSLNNPYPWSFFREDWQSLDNTMTCVGIIVPEKMYNNDAVLVTKILMEGYPECPDITSKYSDWELKFLEMKSKCKLFE